MEKENSMEAGRQQGVGRINRDSHRQTGEIPPVRDISYIDRQEGDMNNGELGGNFIQDVVDKNQSYGSRKS